MPGSKGITFYIAGMFLQAHLSVRCFYRSRTRWSHWQVRIHIGLHLFDDYLVRKGYHWRYLGFSVEDSLLAVQTKFI